MDSNKVTGYYKKDEISQMCEKYFSACNTLTNPAIWSLTTALRNESYTQHNGYTMNSQICTLMLN